MKASGAATTQHSTSVAEAPHGVHDVLCCVASAPSQPEAELRERQAAVREAFTEIVGPVVRRSE